VTALQYNPVNNNEQYMQNHREIIIILIYFLGLVLRKKRFGQFTESTWTIGRSKGMILSVIISLLCIMCDTLI
jgi:hypothetical protein